MAAPRRSLADRIDALGALAVNPEDALGGCATNLSGSRFWL
jgi:hypothetical protein